MDLNILQTRGLYLAGAVAFPKPFPCAGAISIQDGHLSYPTGTRGATFVVVQEKGSLLEPATTRVVLKVDVAAIFFPGDWQGEVFQFAEPDGVHDFEKGEWFLHPDIDADKISEKLKIDIRRPDSGARAIVFVPESKPVLSTHEPVQTAGSIEYPKVSPCC